jgi:hypothetical protein
MEREERRWRPQSNKNPKSKIKIKQKRMKHALLNATNANSAAESNATTTTRCIKNTYMEDPVFPSEKDEPKMTKARCILRRRCRSLQCVRDGEGGAAVAAPIKQKNQIPKTKQKQKRMKHALLNATNANAAAQSNATTTTRCIQKQLL